MALQIQIDQAGAAAGEPGKAREDLVLGVPVVLTATGGPYLKQLWTVRHRPIDVVAGVRSACALNAPESIVTQLTPIDLPGTYAVRCTVDSGSGLGAKVGDTADVTFYAGPTLAVDPTAMPRRVPAFGETTEHNVPDAIDPAGNPEGWSRELARWFAAVNALGTNRIWAWGRVTMRGFEVLNLDAGNNVASMQRLSKGTVSITFARAMPNAKYAVISVARGVGGTATASNETVDGFTLERADLAGSLIDADFSFHVQVEP